MEFLRAIRRGPRLEKDKGYAWLILVMSFLSHSLHIGFSFGLLGNLTVANQSHFGISLQQSSTIGSVHTGLYFMFGPISSVLVKKFGCRVTEIAGGLCLILGIGLSALSTQLWHAYLLFGVLSAIGVSITYMASSEVIALHFQRYRNLAYALAVLGYYVGMVVWPSVSQKLLDDYSYSKAMLIMSSVHIVHVIAGVLFYQPRPSTSTEEVYNPEMSSDMKISDRPPAEQSDSHSDYTSSTNNTRVTEEKRTVQAQQPKPDGTGNKTVESVKLWESFKMLLKIPKIWIFLVGALLSNLCMCTFLILINDFILNTTDLSNEAVSLGITILGIANIVGCVGVVTTSRLHFDRLVLHAACILTFGAATIIIAFSSNKMMYYSVAVVWGLAQGAFIANLLAVVYNFCGEEHLAVLFGLELFAEGIGAIIGAPLSGLIVQRTSAKYGIIFAGICAISGSLIIMSMVIHKKRNATLASNPVTKLVLPGQDEEYPEEGGIINMAAVHEAT